MSLNTYLYVGLDERTYPAILTEAGSLVVRPGDVHEFEDPPNDGRWVLVKSKPQKKADA